MTKRISTKKALIASLLSLMLCVSMLVGSTFAWFTDTATTGVNTIQAGNLDVALEMMDNDGNWVSAEGKTLQFLVEGKIPAEGTKILWEPGCTYALPQLRVVNAGNLALKYEVVITGLKGDAKLNQAIDWTITGTEDGHLLAGQSQEFSISGHMKEDAGNEYQGLTIDGISITVYATQYTYEKDSKDDTYDTDAKFLYTDAEGNLLIGSADELVYFAKTVNVDKVDYSGKTVKLTADIDLGGRRWAPLMVNAALTFDGNGKTISNFVVSGERNVGFFGTATKCTIQNLTVRNATVTGINHVAAIAGDALCATIDGCKVYDSTITTEVKNNDDGDKAGAIAGYLSAEPNASVTNCTVENCTVKGYRDIGGLVGYANSAAAITGNAVSKVTIVNDRSKNYKGYTTNAEFDANSIVGEYNNGMLDSSNTAAEVTTTVVDVVISSAEDLAQLAVDVNSGTSYKGKTVWLVNDIDLNNEEWTPIGKSGSTFQGIFDGQGHTISNLYINKAGQSDVGLFGVTTNGEIKNFTLHNASVTGYLDVGAIAGTPYTSKYTNIKLTGKVQINGFAYVGGMFGKNAYADLTDLTIDVNEESYVKADSKGYRTYVGGLVGFMGEGNQTVKNVTSNIDVTGSTCDVGGITGIAHYGNTFINCHSSGDVTLSSAQDGGLELEIGGIAGVWLNKKDQTVTLTGCSYTGKLSSRNAEGAVTEFPNNGLVGNKYDSDSSDGTLIIN